MFAARGTPVVAVEPSAEMAAIARRNRSGYTDIEIDESDFEQWDGSRRWAIPVAAGIQLR
jgi:hypothetical protein